MSSIAVRQARPEDYELFTRLFPELGIDDPVPTEEHFASTIAPAAFIAMAGDEGAGYIYGRSLRGTGHVVHIIVSPSHRRLGVGQALMSALHTRFENEGLRTWCLNVKPDNHGALALYRRFGFEDAYLSSVLRFDWSQLDEWAAEPCDATTATPAASEDAAIEGTLGITTGLLDSRRKSGDYVLAALRDEQDWVGAAAFSPSHPGAFPFKVAHPELALPLLAALRPSATQGNMQIVAEDDDALRQFLIERGAVEHLRILHMTAPL